MKKEIDSFSFLLIREMFIAVDHANPERSAQTPGPNTRPLSATFLKK